MGFPGSILTPFINSYPRQNSMGCNGSDVFYLHHLLSLGIREFLQRKLFCDGTLNNFQQNCQKIQKKSCATTPEIPVRGIWSQQRVTTHTADFQSCSSKPSALKLGTAVQGAASPGQGLNALPGFVATSASCQTPAPRKIQTRTH